MTSKYIFVYKSCICRIYISFPWGILHNKVLIIIMLKITHNKLVIQPKCAFLSAILDF